MNQNELLLPYRFARYHVYKSIIDFQWYTAGYKEPEGTTKVRKRNPFLINPTSFHRNVNVSKLAPSWPSKFSKVELPKVLHTPRTRLRGAHQAVVKYWNRLPSSQCLSLKSSLKSSLKPLCNSCSHSPRCAFVVTITPGYLCFLRVYIVFAEHRSQSYHK